MLQHKAYKYRIYPTKEQEIRIVKTIGCSRFVFNHFLDKWNISYETTGKGLTYNTCSAELPKMKKSEETIWLKEVDSIALQTSLRNLADSFDRFFKKQNQRPRFKSKSDPVQSYTTKNVKNSIELQDKKIKFPKLGFAKIKNSQNHNGHILNATICKTIAGKYFVSLLVEKEIYPLPKTGENVGIDLGLSDFAILSTREKI